MKTFPLGALILMEMLALAGCTAPTPATESPSSAPSDTPSNAPSGGSASAPSPPADLRDPLLPPLAEPLPRQEVEAFSAVATMDAGADCTGTLIDTGAQTGPAYVLTNGRCVGGVGRSAQATTLREEWAGTVEFLRAAGNLDSTVSVDVAELVYSTMRYTDTAIVRLESTLGALAARGVRPLPITDSEPPTGEPVVNVGVPIQGLERQEAVLRRGHCTLGAQHTLIESAWLWFGVWSTDCPGIVQGSGGSAVVTVDNDGVPIEIVGMISTTSWGVRLSDGGACTIGRPCQVSDGATGMIENLSYAQSVAGIGRCFDSSTGRFALGGACPLPVSSIWAEQGGGAFRGAGLPDASGRLPEASFVSRAIGVIRTALVPLGDGAACSDAQTYAAAGLEVLPQAGEPWELRGITIAVDLPQVEGHYLLCAVRGDGYDAAAAVLFEVDRTPPLFAAGAQVERLDDGAAIVRAVRHPPELSTVRFGWGAQGSMDCADTAAFEDFFIAPLTLDASDLPATYCIYGMDAAGNATPVTRIDIPAG